MRLIPEPIAPGIARLAVPTDTLPPATTTNAWLLGDHHLTVIDPGASSAEARAATLAALAGRRVERIVLTHHHPDHTSGAHHLAEATGAPILAHPDTQAFVRGVTPSLTEGARLHTDGADWRVLHTPGHAHGHVCLWREADGHVVVGDLLAGEGTILIAPPEGHLATYMHSLRRVLATGASVALPAHGPALDAPAAFQMYLHHRQGRTDQVWAGLEAGPRSAYELATSIYADLPEAVLPIAARQLEAHLTWLRERGLVEAATDDRYRRTTADGS